MSAATQEYDNLPQHDKDLIRIGFEVGWESGWVKRAAYDGFFVLTPTQEEAFLAVIRRKKSEAKRESLVAEFVDKQCGRS